MKNIKPISFTLPSALISCATGLPLCLVWVFCMGKYMAPIYFNKVFIEVIDIMYARLLTLNEALVYVNAGMGRDKFMYSLTEEQTSIYKEAVLIVSRNRRPKDKTYIGKLCPLGHDYEGKGMSLRYISNSCCVTCHNQRNNVKLDVINENYPKDDILLLFPVTNINHYLGRLCEHTHKYHGYNYSLRFKCNKGCFICHKEHLHIDLVKNKLDNSFSNTIRDCLKNGKEGASWHKMVDYSLDELMAHLESQFTLWMNWGNYGTEWHVDHKKPKSLFKYESYKDDEFKRCWSLQNLQPLEATFNLQKNNKLLKQYAHL
jgi:hypothetical protein